MSNSKWMLPHFHDLDVSTDCRSAPAWYYDAAEILLLDYDGEAFLALYSVMKFGGLSPLYRLIHGNCSDHGYSAALLFEADGIYPTGEYILSKRVPYKPIAIALLKSELISARALERPLPIVRNYDLELLPDDLHNRDISQDAAIEFIQSEINAIIDIQIRPSLSEVTFQSQSLYWQPTSIETHSPIELYNALSPSFQPAIRLFGTDEDNCHVSKVYFIVDERKYAEYVQNLATGLSKAKYGK